MARTITFSPEELERAIDLRDNHANEREYRAALIVLVTNGTDLSRKQIARFFGVVIKTVYSNMQLILNFEVSDKRKWGGGNYYLMTFEEETKFLDNYLLKAQEGYIITMTYLHEEYNR
jgi:hypothetical protein